MVTRTLGISAFSASSMRSQMTWLSPHRHVGVDDQMELDEGGAAGDARLQVVHLQRALGIGRDDVADADMLVLVDGRSIRPCTDEPMTCQPCQRMLSATMTASSGSRIVQPVSTAPIKAGNHADRGDDVGHDVVAVGDQRRRTLGAAGADQDLCPERG